MKPARDIETLVRDLSGQEGTEAHDRILGHLIGLLRQRKNQKPAAAQSDTGRTLMNSPIAKLAVSAVVIAAVVLGLLEFIGSDSSSGVVWAEVAERTQASQAVIYRIKLKHSTTGDTEPDFFIAYLSAARCRQDAYKADQVTQSLYCDFDTRTVVWVGHEARQSMQRPMDEQTLREQHGAWADPSAWVQDFLSRDYTELGQKTIDGVLCEGIETTDPTWGVATFAVEKLVARVWVSVETGYPVLLEGQLSGPGGDPHVAGVLDQFQWNAELDPSLFEPDIPSDYQQIH